MVMKMYINDCNIEKIMNSGQCFRISPIQGSIPELDDGNQQYIVQSADKACIASTDVLNVTTLHVEESDVMYWSNYFDVNRDYTVVEFSGHQVGNQFLTEAIKYGEGLRMLNQDPFECLISFIISQRKSIPAIKSAIRKLCMEYGKCYDYYGMSLYAFPKAESLVRGYNSNQLKSVPLGYRDEYVYLACSNLSRYNFLEDLSKYSLDDYQEALRQLKLLRGVGDKVANCTLLYSLGYTDAFPVDVWMQRVLDEYFDEVSYQEFQKECQGIQGILQLYMFYYIRSLK